MTLTEILEHKQIRSDRYAMAAISCIYKAFGDPIRSKECWPWGRDVQCEWLPSIGLQQDIMQAVQLLDRALERYEEEQEQISNNTYAKINDNNTMGDLDKQIKSLKRRLNKATLNLGKFNKTSNSILNVSEATTDKISEVK